MYAKTLKSDVTACVQFQGIPNAEEVRVDIQLCGNDCTFFHAKQIQMRYPHNLMPSYRFYLPNCIIRFGWIIENQ